MANYEEFNGNRKSFDKAISTAIDIASQLGKMGDAHSLPEQRESAFAYYELEASLNEAIKRLRASFKVGEDLYWKESNSVEINDTSEFYRLYLGSWRDGVTDRDPSVYKFETREEALVEFKHTKIAWAKCGFAAWECRLVNSSTKEVEYLG